MSIWKRDLKNINFPINKKYSQLNKSEKDILWKGKNEFKGLNAFFDFLKRKSYVIFMDMQLIVVQNLFKV